MRCAKRKTKDGYYYSFIYDDPKTGKPTRLKKSQHPHFTDRKAAEAWAKSQTAYTAAQKDRIAKKVAWKNQFYEFEELLTKFQTYQQKQAPNSWDNTMLHLKLTILPWFLGSKSQNNVNAWHFLFDDFRHHLATEAKTLKGKKIEKGTANKSIHALNSFLTYLHKTGLLDPDSFKKCEAFPDGDLNHKSYECVIEQNEFDAIHARLEQIHPGSADFFYVAYHTGMRFNELFGLPMNFVYAGKLTGSLDDELRKQQIDYYGYIVLESQPADKIRKRAPDGSIARKPLKGRSRIDPKNNRIIPIMDKECWNILARRYKDQKRLLGEAKWGQDPINYMLFADLFYSKPSRELDKAYRGSGFPLKTFHDCRHSFCTLLVGRTRSFFLARAILGHKSNAFERYLHIYDAMARKAVQGSQEIEEVS
jgi:integrase